MKNKLILALFLTANSLNAMDHGVPAGAGDGAGGEEGSSMTSTPSTRHHGLMNGDHRVFMGKTHSFIAAIKDVHNPLLEKLLLKAVISENEANKAKYELEKTKLELKRSREPQGPSTQKGHLESEEKPQVTKKEPSSHTEPSHVGSSAGRKLRIVAGGIVIAGAMFLGARHLNAGNFAKLTQSFNKN